MWILIVIGFYAGGFGFSQEFTNEQACKRAIVEIQPILKPAPAKAICVPKN